MAKIQRDPARERMWRERVAAWAASGLSIRAFCQQHQVTETTFQYWRRELRERDAATASVAATSAARPTPVRPTFVPVTVLPASPMSVEIRCPSGHVIILTSCDGSSLSNVFAALASPTREAPSC